MENFVSLNGPTQPHHPHPYTPSIIDMRLAFLTMAASSEWVFGASSLCAQSLLRLPPPPPDVVSTFSPCVVLSTKYLDVGLQEAMTPNYHPSQSVKTCAMICWLCFSETVTALGLCCVNPATTLDASCKQASKDLQSA